MLNEFLGVVGGHEILNNARTAAYLRNVGSPFSTPASCSCPTITPAMLGEGDGVYTTPATDPAPWYDVDVPASADFLGVLVLDVTGLDGGTTSRKVTTSISGGGSFGPARRQPRTMTWTVLLVGASCCGADYGLHWLEQALLGCCDTGCDGDSLELFDCCPPETMTRPQFLTQHRRVLRQVAMTGSPTVLARDSLGATCAAGGCAAGGEALTVEFTLTAANPQLWTDIIPLLDVDLPRSDTGDCLVWCTNGAATPGVPSGVDSGCAGGCLGTPCAPAYSPLDPRCSTPPPPGVTGPEPCFCLPIALDRACYDLDLSTRPQWSSDVPVIVVRAGSTDLRDVKITFYEKPDGTLLTCDQIADANRCANSGSYFITFIPANGALTIDGQTGRSTVEYQGGCTFSDSVFGDDAGGPMRVTDLTCSTYCVCIETSMTNPPAADAGITIGVSGRRF